MSNRMFDISEVNNAWLGMWRGLRPYGVALTVIWTMCAVSVLSVFAVAADGWWLRLVLALGAVLELGLSALTLRFLIRASTQGRFDT
ncbi:MAG TPA: hypothetical protein VHB69_03480 [Mycobacteriales bacterium]|nr:hypothetical protein [Mycobacteriales bacterium]